MGGSTVIAEGPLEAIAVGHQQVVGRGITVWSALTSAVKLFRPAATMQEFLENN